MKYSRTCEKGNSIVGKIIVRRNGDGEDVVTLLFQQPQAESIEMVQYMKELRRREPRCLRLLETKQDDVSKELVILSIAAGPLLQRGNNLAVTSLYAIYTLNAV